MNNLLLVAIPMFIFMGTMLEKSKLAQDLLQTIGVLFGPLRGGLALAVVIVGARWPGPLRRIAEALGAWIPISFGLACVGYFGGEYLFEWLRDARHRVCAVIMCVA